MRPDERALRAVADAARAHRARSIERCVGAAARAGVSDVDAWPSGLSSAGRLTVNFHPDRLASDGRSVADGLASTGRYRSQWVTGISNGGRSAFSGGDRHGWETRLFGGAYEGADPVAVEHPIYGAFDLLRDPHGGSPRFGSSYLVLADGVRRRVTLCVGDSHAGPADIGTFDEPWSILAGLAEQAAAGRLLGRVMGIVDLGGALDGSAGRTSPSRELDGYVEAQVHGGIELRHDVDAIVLDPSFRGTAVHDCFDVVGGRFGVEVRWHTGSELDAAAIPSDFRGPTMPDLGRRVARTDGVVDAEAIGRAARGVRPGPMLPAGDPPDSDAQQVKYLWHTVLAFGHDADPATR